MSETNQTKKKKRNGLIAFGTAISIAAIIAGVGGYFGEKLSSNNKISSNTNNSSASSTSNSGEIKIPQSPTIQTVFMNTTKNTTLVFSAISKSKKNNLQFQWYSTKESTIPTNIEDATLLPKQDYQTIESSIGYFTSTLNLPSRTFQSIGSQYYFCIVSIKDDSASSQTSGIYQINVINQPKAIFSTPQTIYATLNETSYQTISPNASFAGGSNVLISSYQWYKSTTEDATSVSDMTLIKDANNSSYTLTANDVSSLTSSTSPIEYYYLEINANIDGTDFSQLSPGYPVNVQSPMKISITYSGTNIANSNNNSYIDVSTNSTTTISTSIQWGSNINNKVSNISYQWYSTNPIYKDNTSIMVNGVTYYIIPKATKQTYLLTSDDTATATTTDNPFKYFHH